MGPLSFHLPSGATFGCCFSERGEQRFPSELIAVAPQLSGRAEVVPSAVFDLYERRVTPCWAKADVNGRRVGDVASDMPEVGELSRRIPLRHHAPFVLRTR